MTSPQYYDPNTGSWTLLASQPSRFQTGLATLTDGTALLAGGADSASTGTYLSTAQRYDPASGWSNTGSMLDAEADFLLATLSDGRAMAVTYGDGTQLYDRPSGMWSAGPGLLNGPKRLMASGVNLPNGQFLVAGGCAGPYPSNNTPDAELFDPASNTWTEAGSLPAAGAGPLLSGLGSN